MSNPSDWQETPNAGKLRGEDPYAKKPEEDFREPDPDIDYFKLGLLVCAVMITIYIAVSIAISYYF